MSQILHDMLERFAADAYQPVTFVDRGVTVPFTTPLLLGARVKPNEFRPGLEVVIGSLSGGPGFYIVPWIALTDICSPTIHDRRLWQRLADQTVVTPALVREIARSVAAEGLAGREAAAAVGFAHSEDVSARMRTNFMLLLDLIRRTETGEEASVAPESDEPANRERRAKRAMARFAARLCVSPDIVESWIDGIAGTMAGIGIPGDPRLSRTRELAQRLQALARDIGQWLAAHPDPAEQHGARVVLDAAQLTVSCVEAALRDLDGHLADTPLLLEAWRDEPAVLQVKATRPDWVLDGWDVILELWRDTAPEVRTRSLWKMALMAPVMPREVKEWLGIEEDWERPFRLRRQVRGNEDWRSGRIIDMVARNERLRARVS